ncbi:hypothetical protein CDO27_27500 (plasmid) [Sinorhizobium meliloti]|nr:hypothetical protein SMRU11_17015 [Sinorhizobium meliloti RU11/001]ASP81595.1 hypothetical protein CDO27_27500 [Sinorhizobium meliloti]
MEAVVESQARMEQENESHRRQPANYKSEVLSPLNGLSDCECLALLWLMRRGNPNFIERSEEIRGLLRKNVVFPIDDNHEIYAVRGDIWAAREQYMSAHKDKRTPELFPWCKRF